MTASGGERAGAPGGGLTTSLSPLDDLFPGRLGAWAGRVLGTVAATVLFAMMVLTFVDVTGRKLFTRPVYGAYEITEFLMGMLIFCALPLVTAREGHVSIDVLDHLVPAWFRALAAGDRQRDQHRGAGLRRVAAVGAVGEPHAHPRGRR